MKLSQQDISKHRPANNYVLLKPAIDTSKFKYGSAEFYAPLSLADGKTYDAFSTAPVVCTLIATPKRLVFDTQKVLYTAHRDKDLHPDKVKELARQGKPTFYTESEWIEGVGVSSMTWKTKMELKAGDIVWCSRNAMANAEKVGNTIEADGELYHLIQYSEIYLVKKGDNIKMLNGYILCSPVPADETETERKLKALGLESGITEKKVKDKVAVVRYVGDSVEYIFHNRDRFDFPEVKVGDTVLLAWQSNRRLENDLYKFFSQEELIVSRRCNIAAVLS